MGQPILHVRAPMVFKALFAKAGLHHLANLDGLIVTVPHKIAILPLLAELAPMAARGGPSMSSGVGRKAARSARWSMVWASRKACAPPVMMSPANACCVAGGVGTAIAFALVEHACGEIGVYDVDDTRAGALVDRLKGDRRAARVVATPDPTGYPIAINATPLGMKPDDPLPFHLTRLDPGALVAEVIMKPLETRPLEMVRARGNPIIPGTRMLDYQAPLVLDFLEIPRV